MENASNLKAVLTVNLNMKEKLFRETKLGSVTVVGSLNETLVPANIKCCPGGAEKFVQTVCFLPFET